MHARVVALHRKRPEGGMEAAECLEAVAHRGFVGDKHFDRRSRQALLISTESLDELGFQPGELREQLTIDLKGLQSLPPGTRIKAGGVHFVLEMDCTPCARMAQMLGEDPENFKSRAALKRGMLAVVASSGTVRVGDEVAVVGEPTG